MFNAFIEHVTGENRDCLSSLKYIFLAGEVLLQGWVEKFRDLGTTILLENIYGPTECTIYASQYSLAEWEGPGPIPIGKPLQNLSLYILDTNGCIQPINIVGELCISGIGLARGYLNRPELTCEKFVAHELHELKKINKSFAGGAGGQFFKKAPLLYRTGDLARWLPDGNIEFLGRIDQQVKIRGFRIELGEIEMCLTGHHEIKAAVVICREDAVGNKYLCAYIVRSDEIAAELSSTEVREYLSQTLPEYMIPAYFIQVEKIPLTLNGKIDRKALPAPEIKIRKDHTAPRNETEKKLVEIWAKVLRVEKDVIGIESNFFEMGGNSLNLIIMMGEMYKEFQVDMPFAQIIEHPRIMDVANFIIKNNLYEQPVVLLNQKRQKKVFCFPDQMGYGYGYGNLAALLDDYSFYSLTFIEDEDRINRYIDIITGIQPTGPYVFFGHSAAGRLTYVIAAAFEKRGYEVSNIVFADCVFIEDSGLDVTEEYLATFRMSVGEFLRQLNAEFLLEKVFAKAKKYLNYLVSIVSLERLNANVHLVISEEVQQEAPDSHIHSWEKLTTKTYKIYKGCGTHRGMLRGSDLEKNKVIIKKILDEIEFGAE
jgi:fengycin family lipopeptide synthetase D